MVLWHEKAGARYMYNVLRGYWNGSTHSPASLMRSLCSLICGDNYAMLYEAFDKIDTDGSGTIDADELEAPCCLTLTRTETLTLPLTFTLTLTLSLTLILTPAPTLALTCLIAVIHGIH